MPTDQTDHISDEQLAKRTQAGEVEAFSLLVERYTPKIQRYTKRFLFHYEDREDIIQSIFLKTYIHINSFQSTKRFSPWIYRIAHNECINAIKKKKKEPLPLFDSDILFPVPIAKEKTDRHIEQQQLQEMIDRRLQELNPKYREVIILYYIEEMTYKEISDILHIPTSTIGVRLGRAKKLLRLAYEKTYGQA